jgi:arylsulfatase A-like enzyme
LLRKLLDSPWTYFALAGLLALFAVASQFRIHFPTRPSGTADDIAKLQKRDDTSVVFILIDTLRADRLSSYGYHRPTSPMIDSLASTGIRFAHVESQSSWTKCSMASLWTSLYPVRTGVTRFDNALPPEAQMPAERLHQAGFRTAGFWRNGWVANNFGFDQGFDVYYQPLPSKTPEKYERHAPGTSALQGTDLDATDAAVEFLRSYGNQRFFLYLHYMDVHQYLFDQEAADLGFGTKLTDAYDASIHWTDRNVGRLLQELEDRDLFKKTIVVVAADHGESFYEHGHEGHATTLYNEVTEVPLVIALPFRMDPVVVQPMVRNVDIWPTIYDLLGMPPTEPSDGRSLVPLIEAAARGESDGEAPPPAYAYLDTTWGRAKKDAAPLVSIRTGTETLLFPSTEPDRAELFDERDDPKEQRNLAKELPDRTKELTQQAEAYLKQPVAWGKPYEVEIDEIRLGQLRALGYVVDEDKDLKPLLPGDQDKEQKAEKPEIR